MNGNLTQVKGLTPVEAIIKGNAERRAIAPNSRFNRILLETNEWKIYSWPNNTGTGFAIEAKDKPFGKTLEKEFTYEGEQKVLVYNVRKEDIGAKNLMHLFEHQFRQDGESTMQLVNAKTGKQILTVEGLHEADEIILKVVGDIRNFKLTDRNGGVFETADTKIWATDSSAVGFLQRGSGLGFIIHRIFYAVEVLVDGRGVLYEDAAKVETGAQAPAVVGKDVPRQITIASPAEMNALVASAKEEVAKVGNGALAKTKELISKVGGSLS
ncbi:TPA: hypothetical protein HA225_01315 [Candidatus Micrarchaeota archaeon]|nr:hypothetical protein [Candidatus Micrarchaeota archaeon]